MLQRVAVWSMIWQNSDVAAKFSAVLRGPGVCLCVTVCCNVLQFVVVCCSVLQSAVVRYSALQCVAVCCRVLQCVAVCCSVLQCGRRCNRIPILLSMLPLS